MKRFLIQLSAFLLLFFCVDFTIGNVIHWLEGKAMSGVTERNYYINNRTQEKVLLFGSSRSLNHYNPQIFRDSLNLSAFNCGENETGVILFHPRLELIKKRYYPQIIVYDVYYHDFLNGLRFKNIDHLKTLRTSYGKTLAVDSMFWHYDATTRYKMLSKLYSYNSTFINIILDNLHETHFYQNGFCFGNIDQMQNEPFVDNSHHEYDYDIEKLRLLEKFIVDNKNDIELYFSISPEYGRTNDEMFEPVKYLCSKYNIPLLNHYCDTTFTFHKEFFINQNHLNRQGADLYTSAICSEIKEMEKNRK